MSEKDEGVSLGSWGERRACEHLKQKDMILIERNFRSRDGEIDLVMKDAGTLVFVEVKTRASSLFGSPEESIHKRKLERLFKTVHAYLDLQEDPTCDWRIDVVAIECTSTRTMKRLDHYSNIALIEE